MKIASIALAQLHQLQSPFIFNHGPIPNALKESIQAIGITHYPQILETDAYPILITGQRRIQTAHELNTNQNIPVIVYAKNEITFLEAFGLHLFENLATRKFNSIEKSNILHILATQFKIPHPSLLKDYLPLLDLPLKESTVIEFLALQKLQPSAKDLVASGTLQVDSALRLQKFDLLDQDVLIHLIGDLHLGVNPQKLLLELSWEIMKKNRVTPKEWLETSPFKDILSEKSWTQAQKWACLELELRKKRFPFLSKLENDFKDIKKNLRLPPSIQLQHPPYFETSDYLIQFRFKNLEEYEKGIRLLSKDDFTKTLAGIFKLTAENDEILHP